MKRLFSKLYDWWNPPCPKHPGHRIKEFDGDYIGMGDMCELCYEDWRRDVKWAKDWRAEVK